jgi:hypothetical protein
MKDLTRRGWLLALTLLLLSLLPAPVSAARLPGANHAQGAATTVNLNIYLQSATLRSLFQSQINQRTPALFNDALAQTISRLPRQDQEWARQMASALIQPSVLLTGLQVQSGGLATSLRISLYNGDPLPINASLLLKFSALNSATLQVSAAPLSGSPTLVSGPLATLQVPFGSLNRVKTTPGCGSAALLMGLRYPLNLNLGSTQMPSSTLSTSTGASSGQQQPAAGTIAATVELPAASLAALGNSVGTVQVNSAISAQNISIGVQGGDLTITSDLYLGTSLPIGSATTVLQPAASNGSLAVHVLSTSVSLFELITFPYNSYNQRIEQMLNTKLNGALGGKFYITQASVGPSSAIPCVAADSLLLSGRTAWAA